MLKEPMSEIMRPHISVAVPVYSCAACLPKLYERLRDTLQQITPHFEILLVNDCSPDNAWEVIRGLCERDARVKGINFSRNFGQHYAITAALDRVSGDWIVVMDCDLQDQPEEIAKLYRAAQSGYDVVFGRRASRKDGFFKRFSSRAFNWLLGLLMGETLDPTIANFGIYRRTVIDSFRQIREVNRSFPLFIRWLGFTRTAIDVEHAERAQGRSSYTFRKLLAFAMSNVIAYSNKPLTFSIYVGLIISCFSFVFGIYLICRYLIRGVPVAGWSSLMVSLYFISGLLFANIGLLGLYMGKVFDEVKKRPLYVVREEINLGADAP
jgi:glycosyltransferase involved in cell wall biosynthesis